MTCQECEEFAGAYVLDAVTPAERETIEEHFEGSQSSDGNLAGNYCRQDQSGQCVGDYGIWSIAPATKYGGR